jgi:hypothetical protein
MKTTRVLSALLAALLLVGPLASLASAQQPAEAGSPVGQAAPPAGQVPAAQPPAADLFQETLRAEQATSRHRGIYDAGAVVVNLVLVPGRAVTCVLGGVIGLAVLGGTLGTGYRPASAAVHEGCGGKWLVSGDDLRPETVSGRPMEFYLEQR